MLFAGLTDYLKTNEYSTGEAHQLRLSLEKVSGKISIGSLINGILVVAILS
jgi:hypothetical protein